MLAELLPKREHVHVDRAATAAEIPAPYVLQKLLARQHDTGMAHHIRQQIELAHGKRHGCPIDEQLARLEVQGKGAQTQNVLAAPAAPIGGAAQHGAHAAYHFHHTERLRDVLIRPGIQCPHDVQLRVFSCDHHDGHAGKLAGRVADAPEDFQAIDLGQHDVQNHHIRDAFGACGAKRRIIGLPFGLDARLCQGVQHQLTDVLIILDIVDSQPSRTPSTAEAPDATRTLRPAAAVLGDRTAHRAVRHSRQSTLTHPFHSRSAGCDANPAPRCRGALLLGVFLTRRV